jgi:hypothetical protein
MPKVKPALPEIPKHVLKYDLEIRFTEDILASSPANPEVYKEYIASRAPAPPPAPAAEADAEAETPGTDEVATLPPDKTEEKGWSVFHKDPNGLFIFEYHIKGFFKEASAATTRIPACKSKIDKWLFVAPRRIYFERDGACIPKPEDVLERPIRMMTMQGPRTSVKRSDMLLGNGIQVKCQLTVLPLGQSEITENVLRTWLDYGQYVGISEWRNGGYGRFEYTLTAQKVR